MIDIQLLHTPLQPQQCINFVTSESAGGIDVFMARVARLHVSPQSSGNTIGCSSSSPPGRSGTGSPSGTNPARS